MNKMFDLNEKKEREGNLLKEVQGGLGVMAQQVVKNETQAGQMERNSLELGVSVLCHLHDRLGDQSQDRPSATF